MTYVIEPKKSPKLTLAGRLDTNDADILVLDEGVEGTAQKYVSD